MDQTLSEDGSHVFVLQRVVNDLSFPAVLHQPGLPKSPQLMGDGGLAHVQERGDVADAHFGPQQGAKYPDSGGIAENLEKVGQIQQNCFVRHLFPYFGHHVPMDDPATVAFDIGYFFFHRDYFNG
jgi:hypothetical protein